MEDSEELLAEGVLLLFKFSLRKVKGFFFFFPK